MAKPTVTERDMTRANTIVFNPTSRTDQGIPQYVAIKTKNKKWSLETYSINPSTKEITKLEVNTNLSNNYIRKHFNDIMTEVNNYKLPYLLRISDYYKILKLIRGLSTGERYIKQI